MGKKNRKSNNKNIMKMGGGAKDNNNNKEKKEDRFDAAETRPQFRPVKKQQTKVVLDERFSSVLTDPRFELHAKDKYGRRKKNNNNNNNKQINKKDKNKKKNGNNNKEELGIFYTIEEKQQNEENNGDDEKEYKPHQNDDDNDDDDSSSSSSDDDGSDSRSNTGSANDDDDDDDDVNETSNNEEDPASRIAYLTAFSRGEIDMSSSSSSDDDDDDSSAASDSSDGGGKDSSDDNDDGEEDPVYGTAGVLDPSTKVSAEEEIEISYDPSPYLVVADMDWDHIRAVDLFVILSSFTPPGSVKKVQIFQSDFGIQQMAKDKLYGPSDIWKKNKNSKNTNKATTTTNNSGSDDEKENDDSDSESSAASGDDDSEEEKDDDYEVSDDDEEEEEPKLNIDDNDQLRDNDFDPEKLRAYEASKLKYYFAVVEFADPDHADIAYREIDGQEFEHSSAAIDLRTLPPDQVDGVVSNRPMRDEATSVPGDYEPPEFVVSALQQTNVECTWDQGDADRERKLTKYGSGGGWQSLAETDDLKAYLASDGSSDDESDEEMASDKGANMRKLLGLDNSDDDDEEEEEEEEQENIRSGSEDEENNNDKCMEIKYIPGKAKLEEKIRSKLQSKGDEEEEPKELTPWEKYKEKRRLKRRERRQAARGGGSNKQGENVDGPQRSTGSKKRNDEIDEEASEDNDNADDDDFLIGDGKKRQKKSSKTKDGKKTEKANEELELLLAGEADEEEERDYDIRGIQRLEKNKGKKLRGLRKRKEDRIAADVSGTDFQVNVNDSRFAAVMEGSDARFGIDKTDPNYKDTSGMREILVAQTTRRKKKRKKQLRADNKNPDDVVVAAPPDVSAEQSGHSAGSNALSSLVQRLKSNVAKSSLV